MVFDFLIFIFLLIIIISIIILIIIHFNKNKLLNKSYKINNNLKENIAYL